LREETIKKNEKILRKYNLILYVTITCNCRYDKYLSCYI